MAAKRIHFIGGGQMAEAIIRAVIGKGAYEAAQISVADVKEERNLYLKNTYGIHAAVSQAAELGEAELIIIAVRPQDDLAEVGRLIAEHAAGRAAVLWPNYVYYFIESLADAGVLAGLSREQACRSRWRMWKGPLPCCATAASIRASFWTSTILRAASVSMLCMS